MCRRRNNRTFVFFFEGVFFKKASHLTSSSPVAVLTESMLWLKVTARGASMSCSDAVTGGLFDDPESCLALLSDGGVAAGGGDSSPPRGCRPLFAAAFKTTVSTIHAKRYRCGPPVQHNMHFFFFSLYRRQRTR